MTRPVKRTSDSGSRRVRRWRHFATPTRMPPGGSTQRLVLERLPRLSNHSSAPTTGKEPTMRRITLLIGAGLIALAAPLAIATVVVGCAGSSSGYSSKPNGSTVPANDSGDAAIVG